MDIYLKALDLLELKKRFAWVSLVETRGSVPQKAGAHALVEREGKVWGTLGGGCLEAECRRRALLALDENRPELFDIRLDEIQGWDDGLICGGRTHVWVDPHPEKNEPTWNQYAHSIRSNPQAYRGVMIHHLRDAMQVPGTMIWMESDTLSTLPDSPLRDLAIRCIREEIPCAFKPSDERFWFLDPLVAPPRLIIAGAGHIGKACCKLGAMLGFSTVVIDDRALYANRENLPEANEVICDDIPSRLHAIPKDPRTMIVIVTRGHQHDGAALAACVRSAAGYIGMIGSRRKTRLIKEGLVREGYATSEELNRIHSPIGLDIGAESVPEIALSIMAQLVAFRRGKTTKIALDSVKESAT